jgi:tetratricopeptide (TPR) repeat protein
MISWFSERYAERSFTLIERVLTQQRVLLHYLTLLFFPHPSRLNLDYDFPVSHGLGVPCAIAITFIAAALVLCVRLAKSRPVISFAIFWFYANLFIESSILALEMVYEHRLYMPSIGIFLLFAVIFYDHVLRFPKRRYWGVTGLVILVTLFSVFSFRRNAVWKNDLTLWSDVIKKSPQKSRPHNNLGNAYLSRGNPKRAVELHKRAIKLDPKNHDAHYNLANDYLRTSRMGEAIGFYKKAVELKPDYAKAYANLGTVYNNLGRYDEAIEQARLALKHRPHYVDVYYNLANAHFYKKDYQAAIKYYKHVISVKPDHDKAYNNLGGTYMLLGEPEKAIGYFQSAGRYNPQAADYINNLGMAYRGSGNPKRAIENYSLAIRMKPDYFEPYYNTARVLVEQKKIAEAIQILSSYLQIDPNHARTHMTLGLIWADYTTEGEKAIRLLEESLRLGPGQDKTAAIREKIELIKKRYGIEG